MKKNIIICILFFSLSLYAGVRDLIILLDDGSERVAPEFSSSGCVDNPTNSLSAVTSNLMIALYQKAAPILVTTSVWRNFIERRQIFNDFITLSIDDLLKKYSYLPCFGVKNQVEKFKSACDFFVDSGKVVFPDDALFSQVSMFFTSHYIDFKPTEWKLYKVGSSFCLLVPISYMQGLEPVVDSPFTTLRPEELQLGLKLSVPMTDPFNLSVYPQEVKDMSKEFISLLPKLFVTRNDVKHPIDKHKHEEYAYKYLHQWHIFLNGHGSPAAQSKFQIAFIAGLQEQDFKTFLHFLNDALVTEFFFYLTCYAGGQHLLTPYERQWLFPSAVSGKILQATRADMFNFTIATGTLFQNVVQSSSGGIATTLSGFPGGSMKKSIKVVFIQNFVTFFKQLKDFFGSSESKTARVSLESIVNYVHMFIDPKTGKILSGYQVPVVRYPGTEWFSLIGMSDRVMRLSNTFVAVHEAEGKPIALENEEMIIIDTTAPGTRRLFMGDEHSEILVPLKIKTSAKGIPAFISSATKNAVHYIDAIETDYGLLELLNAFMPFKDSFYSRTFYIRRITCKNDMGTSSTFFKSAPDGTITLDDVLILNSANNPLHKHDTKRYNGIMCKNAGTSYQALWETTNMLANNFLVTKALPPIQKIPAYILTYPFKDDLEAGPKLKALFEMLKEHGKKKPASSAHGAQAGVPKIDDLTVMLQTLEGALTRLATVVRKS